MVGGPRRAYRRVRIPRNQLPWLEMSATCQRRVGDVSICRRFGLDMRVGADIFSVSTLISGLFGLGVRSM